MFGRLTSLYCIEEVLPLGSVLDIRINEKTVHLGVDVFDGYLEPVEAPRLSDLDFSTESLHLIT